MVYHGNTIVDCVFYQNYHETSMYFMNLISDLHSSVASYYTIFSPYCQVIFSQSSDTIERQASMVSSSEDSTSTDGLSCK